MVVLDPGRCVEFTCAPYLADQGDRVRVIVVLEDAEGLAEIGAGKDVTANSYTEALAEACSGG